MTETEFDVARIRRDFPALAQIVNGQPVTWLDTAASAQKPQAVIDAMTNVMTTHYANIHRGIYSFAEETTVKFEAARRAVASFINTDSEDEIVFTRNATEAINLVTATWGRAFLKEGDEVLITGLEHHANIVPWQLLRAEKGIVLKSVPVDDKGDIAFADYKALLTDKTKLVAFTHMSNAIGTILPVKQMVAMAKAAGAMTLVDGSQAILHLPVDVQDLGCDFYAFSGHKLYGPSGIGVLYGRYEVLETMPPYQGGGEMIEKVTLEETTFKKPPQRFEAGTPAIVEAIGLHAAIDYIQGIGKEAITAHEKALTVYALEKLAIVPGLSFVGTSDSRSSIVSFTMAGVHPHDVATIIDQAGVAVRAGHHCAQPLMQHFGVPATIRASLGLYNTYDDIDRLVAALEKVNEIFGGQGA